MMIRRMLRRLLPRPLALSLRREWIVRRVAAQRGHLEGDLQLLPRFVQPSDVCWDIGANTGTYTLALSHLAAHVFAFEPVQHSFDILKEVIRRASLRNVTTKQLAIADVNATGRMTIPIDGFYGGYYLAALDDTGTLAVPIATIDRLIEDGLPEPDFIKCDVEGAEARVIKGAASLIARRHPVWLLETFEDDVLPLMESFGYTAYAQVDAGRVDRVRVRNPKCRNYWFFPFDIDARKS